MTTSPSNIPETAVEAAARADYGEGWDRASEWERSAYLDHSKLLLEAAAPHMLANTWDEAVQFADDEGYLLTHQSKYLKTLNPHR